MDDACPLCASEIVQVRYMDTFRKYRLAVVTSHPVQYQAPLFQKLARHPQIDLTVYYGSDISVRGEIDPGFGIPVKWDRPLLDGYRYQFLNSPDHPHARAREQLRIIAELRRERYDVVFIHSYATATSLLAYLGAWLSITPILIRTESHRLEERGGAKGAVKKIFLRVLFAHTQGFLTIGTRNSEFYKFYGGDEKRFYFTPYSVDNEFFDLQTAHASRVQTRRELDISQDAVVVLYCGKLCPDKRVIELLDAFEQVAKDQNAVLVIVGDGSERTALESASRERRLVDRVRFVGFKNQTELSSYYISADIFALPSAHETWGLVLNEAMIYSLPIIATDHVGAAVDLIQEGVTGFTYPAGDVTCLSVFLRTLILDPDLRRQMGQAARKKIEGWNYDVCVDEIIRAMGDVC